MSYNVKFWRHHRTISEIEEWELVLHNKLVLLVYNDRWSWWIGYKTSKLFFSCSRKGSKAKNSLLKCLNYHLYIISVCVLLLAYEIKYFVYCWHFLLLYCLKLISYVWVSTHYLSGLGYQQFVLIIEGVLNSSALWVYILCVLDKGNHFNPINWAV